MEGKRGPGKGQAFGAAAITHAIKGMDFPKSKQELINEVGNEEVEFEKGQPMKMRDILEMLPSDEYNSPADLEHDVHEALGRAA